MRTVNNPPQKKKKKKNMKQSWLPAFWKKKVHIIYFEGFVLNPPVFRSIFREENVAATLQVFRAEH